MIRLEWKKIKCQQGKNGYEITFRPQVDDDPVVMRQIIDAPLGTTFEIMDVAIMDYDGVAELEGGTE